MRALPAIMIALSLTACTTAEVAKPSAGNWSIDNKADRITGVPTSRVFVESRATNSRSGKSAVAIVQLMCFEKEPIVRFAYDFRVGANASATLDYRFDQKPGRKADVKFLADSRTAVMGDRAALARFVEELATSSVLFVRVTSLSLGRTEAEFRVPGGSAAIDAGYAECPLKRSAGAASFETARKMG